VPQQRHQACDAAQLGIERREFVRRSGQIAVGERRFGRSSKNCCLFSSKYELLEDMKNLFVSC
jgi:hypothetical protein